MERPIRDSASGITLGRDAARREGNFFGFRVTEDRESNSSRMAGYSSAAMSAPMYA